MGQKFRNGILPLQSPGALRWGAVVVTGLAAEGERA